MQLPTANQTMTSKEIADLVEKRHDKVKQSIERLAAREVIAQPPMGDGGKSANGVVEKVYLFTADRKRDTYVVVAQLSPEFTARIVDRWQELEAGQVSTLPAVTDPALAAIVQTVIELDAVKRQQAQQAQQLTALEQRIELMDGDTGYMTVTAYTRSRGIRLPLSAVRAIGKRASKTAKELGIQLGSTPDERFGSVNSYPIALLDEVFAEHMQAA